MEARLIIAYILIAVLGAGVAYVVRSIKQKRREHRRLMRGYQPKAGGDAGQPTRRA